ncbi:hypothetical protein [Siminovitchia sp. FSL W7-1587]
MTSLMLYHEKTPIVVDPSRDTKPAGSTTNQQGTKGSKHNEAKLFGK